MAIYGKTALELYKEIAMCPPEVFPPYNASSRTAQAPPWLSLEANQLKNMKDVQDELVRVVQTEIQEHKALLDAAFL